MKPVTLGLYSWLMCKNARGGVGFSRLHEEMNRGCRAMPICLEHIGTRALPRVSLDFLNETPPYLFCSGCRSVNAARGKALSAVCKDSNTFANEPVSPV